MMLTIEKERQSQTVPPYVPYRSFRNFIDSLKQGIPSRIDRSVMPSMSGALQGQLTAALRYLGLITATGHPTDLLPKLVNSEGPERAKVMREIISRAYPFLCLPFNITTATPRMVEEQFANAGASGGTVDKCVNFFLSAAKEGEMNLSHHLKNMRGIRIQRRPRAMRDQSTQASANAPVFDESTGSGQMVTWAQMLLSKFPSFDPGWPDEVKAKWFDAFDKLMKQEPKKEASETS
jgi:hypothetical protein